MQLPLNVLLYQLSANSNFDAQNIDLSCTYDGIKLFDANYIPDSNKQYLYLISEDMLAHSSILLSQQFLSTSVFLCVCRDQQLHPDTNTFQKSLSMILLYTEDSFPIVFNKIMNIFHDFELWDKNFHLALLQQKNLQELLDLSRDYLVHPMVVLDRNYSLLGYIKTPDSSDPLMEDILDAGYVTPKTMARLRQDGLISTSEHADNPLINWYCLATHDCYYSMMYRFTANGHTVGYALIFRCSVHPKTNYLYLMNTVSENLKLYFQQERFSSRSSSEMYESLLTEILEHPEVSPKQYEDQISYIPGLEMEGHFLLARIDYKNQSELPFSFVCWSLRNSLPEMKPFIYKNSLYILKTGYSEKGSTCFPDMQETELLNRIFRGNVFDCGISNTFFSLMNLPIAIRQCAQAIGIGTNRKKSQHGFFRFEDVSILFILQELKKNIPFGMISSPYYTILKKYDEEHNSDLCDIFMHFLKNSRNINQTSAATFLHRNTVLNKVKKAFSVMQNECEDYPAQIAFILSYLEDHHEDQPFF